VVALAVAAQARAEIVCWFLIVLAASAGGLFRFKQLRDVGSWHFATFRCAAEFGRYRGITDIE
jgi:hypothetical protein